MPVTSVDELIVKLQEISDAGYGNLPALIWEESEWKMPMPVVNYDDEGDFVEL